MAPNINLEIMIPNAFPPDDFKLFNILDIKVSTGYLVFYYLYEILWKHSITGLATKCVLNFYFYYFLSNLPSSLGS